jgi:hypothetical protein
MKQSNTYLKQIKERLHFAERFSHKDRQRECGTGTKSLAKCRIQAFACGRNTHEYFLQRSLAERESSSDK